MDNVDLEGTNEPLFVVAIDPGQVSGYMASMCLLEDFDFTDVIIKLYSDRCGYKEFIKYLINICGRVNPGDIVVYLEDVGKARAGNSASSIASFARHCGFIDGVLETLNCEYESFVIKRIPPKKWQAWFEKFYNVTLAKERGATKKENARLKKERKDQIYEVMKKETGDLLSNQKQADALALLNYGLDDLGLSISGNK